MNRQGKGAICSNKGFLMMGGKEGIRRGVTIGHAAWHHSVPPKSCQFRNWIRVEELGADSPYPCNMRHLLPLSTLFFSFYLCDKIRKSASVSKIHLVPHLHLALTI
jgi:hypothetical protein